MSGYLLAAAGNYNYVGGTSITGYINDSSYGTYAYAGEAVTFLYSAFGISPTSGTYTYTGKAVNLGFAPNPNPINPVAGVYAYTGENVSFVVTPVPPYMNADFGTYSLTGEAATLTLFIPGTFPNVVGMLLPQAQQTLQDAGALVISEIGYFGKWPITINWTGNFVAGTLIKPGVVIAQKPAPLTPIKANAPIVLTVQSEPTSIATPPSQANF